MLPQFFRFIVVNNSGQTVTYNSNGRVNLKVTFWHLNQAGSVTKLVYTQDVDDDLSFVAADTWADGAEEKSDEIDNTANLFLGLHVQLEITHDEGAAVLAGTSFDIYMDAGDATGELQSDATGYKSAEANGLRFVGTLPLEVDYQDDEVVRSSVFDIG